jgi:uncharacterized membrane protein YebE (DUF533 family)
MSSKAAATVIVAMLLAIGGAAYLTSRNPETEWENSEAGPLDSSLVADYANRDAVTKTLMEQAMKDGKLSRKEAKDILEKVRPRLSPSLDE